MNEAAQIVTSEFLAVKLTRKCKHGNAIRGAATGEYRSWENMISRCGNPNATGYKNWGGRGVAVCERWKVFTNFLSDMGPKPTSKHTIERLDNNKGYEPGNCAWRTRKEQCNNTRVNRVITFLGESLTLTQWASKASLTRAALTQRLGVLKWPIEKAILTPLRRKRRTVEPPQSARETTA